MLLDLKLPDGNGADLLADIRTSPQPCAVVVMTANGSVDVAVEMMQQGACDFIEKPISADRLRATVSNQLEKNRLQQVIAEYEASSRRHYHGFIGRSLPMQAVYRIIDAAASSTAPVFITGESGTGKELCAEAIHRQSRRAEQPFIVLNCAAIPGELLESELFGHTRGAFTGATGKRQGAATLARGGTLFLDEIGELPMALQAKLLRFVQTGQFSPLGSSRLEQADIRFICATNRDPVTAIAEGLLREDLYYRLYVVPVHLPPLRERREDIPAIASHLLQRFAREEHKDFIGFSSEVQRRLCQYHWPGNVRQLQNIVRHVVVLNNDRYVKQQHLPAPLNDASAGLTEPGEKTTALADSPPPRTVRPLAMIEREAIEQAIALCQGNIAQAATLLKINPSTIYRKKQAWQPDASGSNGNSAAGE